MTTNPLTVSTADARSTAADALIIGVTQDPDGPVPAHGSEDVDAALGGTLAATLTALGATGKQDELTRIAPAGAVAAPLIVAVGLGPADQGGERGRLESLRRAAGSAVRALTGGTARLDRALAAGPRRGRDRGRRARRAARPLQLHPVSQWRATRALGSPT